MEPHPKSGETGPNSVKDVSKTATRSVGSDSEDDKDVDRDAHEASSHITIADEPDEPQFEATHSDSNAQAQNATDHTDNSDVADVPVPPTGSEQEASQASSSRPGEPDPNIPVYIGQNGKYKNLQVRLGDLTTESLTKLCEGFVAPNGINGIYFWDPTYKTWNAAIDRGSLEGMMKHISTMGWTEVYMFVLRVKGRLWKLKEDHSYYPQMTYEDDQLVMKLVQGQKEREQYDAHDSGPTS